MASLFTLGAACGGGGGNNLVRDAGDDSSGGGLICEPACATNQVCQAADGGNACVPACPLGQAWNGTTCAPAVLCASLNCAAQGRLCEGEPFATCTRCDSNRGYFDNGTGGCTMVMGMCTSQADCTTAGEYCLKLDTDPLRPATCAAPPACVRLQPGTQQGQPAMAYDPATSACKACASCAGVTGSTGNIWPVTVGGNCICETVPGYYFDDSVDARAPRACDADGDGWVVYPARNALLSTDIALRSNARCTLRKISGFVLKNERGEERRLTLGELQLNDATLDLFEPLALDAQEAADAAAQRMPAYGARRLRPSELNPLTKACVNPQADYNQDGLFDIEQTQSSAPGAGQAWLAPYVKLAYFFELHEGYYRPSANAGEPGQYVIAERRRCDSMTFPFNYGGATTSDYWRNCERRRARDFQEGQPASDFGRFTCQSSSGACPVANANALFDVNLRDPATQIPLHASCDTKPSATFTGMNHASQFRCVQFQATVSTPYGIDRTLLWDAADTTGGASYVASQCSVTGASRTIPGGNGAVDAPLTCTAASRSAVSNGTVGFALATYISYGMPGDYTRGCINEGVEWATLCPGMGLGGSQARGNAFSFGSLYCGCGPNFGGFACEVGCPDAQTHYGGTLDPSWTDVDRNTFACDNGYCVNVICQPGDRACKPGRRGLWMCGSLAASEGITAPFTGGAYSLRAGSIPLSTFDRSQPLCQNSQNCNQGYRLR